MALKIKPGMALVLAGPQGSGRTSAAIEAAKPMGTYKVCDFARLCTPFGLSDAMREKPRTLIVDNVPASVGGHMDRLKGLITSKTMMVDRKMQEPEQVKTPNFIFITGAANPLSLDGNDRRFMVVNMPMQKVA